MSKISFPYDLQNLTPADAQPIEANFNRVESHINGEVIERDGSVAMRQQLKLSGDPVAALDAAPKQYVDQVLPIGIVMIYAAAVPPANGKWLLCDGQPRSTTDYPELFAVIGYSYGGSGGSFNMPPLNDRLPLGMSATHPLAQTGGTADAQLPAHSHTIDHGHGASAGIEDSAHVHNVDHYHLLSGSAAGVGDHHHAVPVGGSRGFIVDGVSGTDALITNGQISGYSITPFTSEGGAHGHSISGNTNYMSQVGGQGPNSQGQSVNHRHPITVNAMAGSSGSAGVAATGLNMPPFLSVAYIIRCR